MEQHHKTSQHGQLPFIMINCGALPEALLESELFGHVRGAYTGEVNDNSGMFRLANKGTIFLKEISDLSLPLQVKLLSELDDRAFYPVRGIEEQHYQFLTLKNITVFDSVIECHADVLQLAMNNSLEPGMIFERATSREAAL